METGGRRLIACEHAIRSVHSRQHLLRTSVKTFIPQSTLKTTFELNVLQASSSSDQLTDTWDPHQKVSRKHVVTIAEAVENETA
jgi:hypothetical protein